VPAIQPNAKGVMTENMPTCSAQHSGMWAMSTHKLKSRVHLWRGWMKGK
jgi:hypothetical protein